MLASALGVLASGCANEDDVVATQRSDGLSSDGGLVEPPPRPPECQAGQYKGALNAAQGALSASDAGIKISYSGSIDFAITESLSGEFKLNDDTAALSGMGNDGSSFNAEIHGGECDEGQVQATLENGTYTFYTDAAKTQTMTYDFRGSITGLYTLQVNKVANADLSGFVGTWNTVLKTPYGDLVVSGTWSATRTP